MARVFTTETSNRVDYGNAGGSDPTIATVLLWLQLNVVTNEGFRIFDKSAGTGFWRLQLANDGGATSGTVRLIIDYDGTDAECTTVADSVFANRPFLLAGVWAGTGTAPRIFIGSSRAPLVEASYSSQTVDSGARVTDGGAGVTVGCQTGGSPALGIDGMAAFVHWLPGVALPYGELKTQRRRPRILPAYTQVFSYLGQGIGTDRDLSRYGNHGTVTGTTYARAPELDTVFALPFIDDFVFAAAVSQKVLLTRF